MKAIEMKTKKFYTEKEAKDFIEELKKEDEEYFIFTSTDKKTYWEVEWELREEEAYEWDGYGI